MGGKNRGRIYLPSVGSVICPFGAIGKAICEGKRTPLAPPKGGARGVREKSDQREQKVRQGYGGRHSTASPFVTQREKKVWLRSVSPPGIKKSIENACPPLGGGEIVL